MGGLFIKGEYMEITQVTTIKLEDAEIAALKTLKLAHDDCVCQDCFACDQCPLYFNNHCVGQYAAKVLERQKER